MTLRELKQAIDDISRDNEHILDEKVYLVEVRPREELLSTLYAVELESDGERDFLVLYPTAGSEEI